MSKHPSEQRSYSVDEMMERLREGEREKRSQPQGEMVTRPDGSQVMRVRRRKRRSRQPKAEAVKAAKRQRKSLRVLSMIAIVLLVVAAVAILLILAKYNSRGFQEGLESRIEGSTGAEVAIKGMSVTPLKARAQGMVLEWGEDRFLESLALKGLSTDLGLRGLVGADWGGEEVIAKSGRLTVGQPNSVGLSNPLAGGAEPFEFKRLGCAFMTIEFGDSKKSGALLKNCELMARKGEGGGKQVLLRGGTLEVAGWPPLAVSQGLALIEDGAMNVVSLRATPKEGAGEKSEIVFKSLEPVTPGQPVVLGMELTEFPLATLAGEGMDTLIGGVVTGSAGTVHLKDGTLDAAEIRVEFSGTEATIKGFPFLENLRTRFGDSDYVRPAFEIVRGIYRRGPDGTEFQSLEMEDPGQLMIRGHIEVGENGALSGKLNVGIPTSKVIAPTKRKRYMVFSDPRNGYCWVDIDLAGTIKDPGDNFQNLLDLDAEGAARRRNIKEPAKSRFDELTQ